MVDGVGQFLALIEGLPLEERYTEPLIELARYLKERPLNITDHTQWFEEWAELRDDGILRRAGLDQYPEQDDFEAWYPIEEVMTDDEKEKFAQFLQWQDPANAPSWIHMDFRKILPRTTWLVHKTNSASDVWRQGLKFGSPEVSRLGLTTWFTKEAKRTGGYNFAYRVQDFDDSKYGKECVMFQSAAVLVHHGGDLEYQAIFWGPDVDVNQVIAVHEAGGYYEVAKRNGKVLFRTDKGMEDAILWVVSNANAYRKPLGWTP